MWLSSIRFSDMTDYFRSISKVTAQILLILLIKLKIKN